MITHLVTGPPEHGVTLYAARMASAVSSDNEDEARTVVRATPVAAASTMPAHIRRSLGLPAVVEAAAAHRAAIVEEPTCGPSFRR